MPAAPKTLLIAWGNPARLDDGLGPALAAELERAALPGLAIEADYQLSVETAELLRGFDTVVFADAAVSGPEPFSLRKLKPALNPSFTSHHLGPGDVLALAAGLFKAAPRAYVLALRGYRFDDFGEELSLKAKENLQAAAAFFIGSLRDRSWEKNALPALSPSEN